MASSTFAAAPDWSLRTSVQSIGYTGGRRVAYLLAAFAVALFALAAFDAVFPDSDGWSSVALWTGAGLIFLLTADASGLNFTLVPGGPAELSEHGFSAPFFRYSEFRPRNTGFVLRSRLFWLPLGRVTAANRVDWDHLVVRIGTGGDGPYSELWPLRGAPFRSLLTGIRTRIPADALPDLAWRITAGGGDLHVVGELLTEDGRAALRLCPHFYRSDAQFGLCLPIPTGRVQAASWFRETARPDPRRATPGPVERPLEPEGKP